MKRMYNKITKFCFTYKTSIFAFGLVCLLMLLPELGFAQSGDEGNQILIQLNQKLGLAKKNMISLAKTLLLIAAIFTGVLAAYKIQKGDREGGESLVKYIIGFTVGFIILSVIDNMQS